MIRLKPAAFDDADSIGLLVESTNLTEKALVDRFGRLVRSSAGKSAGSILLKVCVRRWRLGRGQAG